MTHIKLHTKLQNPVDSFQVQVYVTRRVDPTHASPIPSLLRRRCQRCSLARPGLRFLPRFLCRASAQLSAPLLQLKEYGNQFAAKHTGRQAGRQARIGIRLKGICFTQALALAAAADPGSKAPSAGIA